jgi:hypothetical protein
MASRAGKPNKASGTREKAHERAGLTPLMHMLGVLRDETQPDGRRDDMAKAAAPYVHPRLSQVDANVTGQLDIRGWLQSLGEPEG